jgi:GT2 family glycosyltransferase
MNKQDTSMISDKCLPFISIIILNFNGLNILKDCLQSVLESDYPKIEIIVLDNGTSARLSTTPNVGQRDLESSQRLFKSIGLLVQHLRSKGRFCKKIGLLDTKFAPAFYEDVDIYLRAERCGFKIVIASGERTKRKTITKNFLIESL